LGGLIRKPPRFWTASHKATGRVPIAPDVLDLAPLLCANTRASDTRSRSCRVDMFGATRLTRASPPLRATSPARPGTAHVSLGYVLAAIVLKISRLSQREAMLALPQLDDCVVAASPLPAQRCDDEAKRTVFRCAIYTRKSTEHNLDLEFNSLDAQREACEAYIKSHAHEGWRLVADHYDDGGISGASLERPALQTLLADLRAGKINTVVVYKVDRLTRSLADFAKLVELFDQYEVSFVSITQSFNTTSSMGRLTLNVLLSFAQFEREVIGERVRDKIAASKRKGIWVGGPVPLGYRVIDKKLVVVPEEAEAVRIIFTSYLQLGSIGALIVDLDRRGIRTKANGRPDDRQRGGIRFGVGSLAHLIKNRFYIGEVVYRGATHRGEHEPILDRKLFEAVQAKLVANAVTRQVRLKGSPAILTGRIFDDRGNRMSPSHSNKLGVRYRYYVSHAILQKRKADAGSIARVPAAV
jgi:site-specific DNA recombinase